MHTPCMHLPCHSPGAGACRCQIEALVGTREIIMREQKQVAAELANLKAFLVSKGQG